MVRNHEVTGSIPASSIMPQILWHFILMRNDFSGNICYYIPCGGLAQLGERTLHRGDVAGSSPVASTFLMENAGIVPTSLS